MSRSSGKWRRGFEFRRAPSIAPSTAMPGGEFPSRILLVDADQHLHHRLIGVQPLGAVSQLLWPDKDREEWFSLGENHEKVLGFPGFPLSAALQHFHFSCLQSDRTQRGFSSRTGVPGKLACWGGSKAALRCPVLLRVEVKNAPAERSYVRLSSRKAACSSMAPTQLHRQSGFDLHRLRNRCGSGLAVHPQDLARQETSRESARNL